MSDQTLNIGDKVEILEPEPKITIGMIKDHLVEESKKELIDDLKEIKKLKPKVGQIIEAVNLIIERLKMLGVSLPGKLYHTEEDD